MNFDAVLLNAGRKLFLLLLLSTALILPVFLIPREPTVDPVIHSKELACRILLALIALPVIAAAPLLWRGRFDFTVLCLLLFPGANILSAALSGKFLYSFFLTWHLWALPLLALSIYLILRRTADFEKIFLCAVTSAFLTVIYAYLVYFGNNPLEELFPFTYSEEEGRNFIHSFLGNPEYYGGYLAPVAVLCFSRFFRPGCPNRKRAGWVALMVLFLISLLLSGTRGALLGFIAATAVVFAAQLRNFETQARRRLYGMLLAGLAAGTALVVVFSTPNPVNFRRLNVAGRFTELFNLNSPSVRERILFYSVASEMITRNPLLGSGPGTFRLEFYPAIEKLETADARAGVHMMIVDLRSRVAEHAHNDYLEIWTDTGTVGFGAFLLIVSCLLWRFISLKPVLPHSDRSAEIADDINRLRNIRIGAFAVALCILINAAFSFPLHLPVRASLAWIMIGCFFAADRALRRQIQPLA